VEPLRRVDDGLFFAINSLSRHTPWLHSVAVTYAKVGVVLFGALLLAGLVYARTRSSRTLGAAGWAAIATLLALAVNQPITQLFQEARPYTTHPHILLLVSRTTDYSFPSDHAVMAGAVATGLILVSRPLGILGAAAAALMALTRVYVAAHYPWDVLVGLILGAAVAWLGWILLARPLTAFAAWLRQRPGIRSYFAPLDDSSPTVSAFGSSGEFGPASASSSCRPSDATAAPN